MEALINSYVDWIKKGLSHREVGNGWHEIVTPFLNHKNDMIELYLKLKPDGDIIISDGGNTINELNLSGLNLNRSPKRKEELNSIIRSFGINLKNNASDELFVTADKKNFPAVKHRIIQAILAIDDLFMLSEPKVKNFFIDDITDFFDLNEIIFIQDTFFTGKSGFSHKFDFTLPKIKKRQEIVVKAINNPRKDSIGGVLWMIEDTKRARHQTEGLVILNDENNITPEITEALKKYEVPYFTWSERQKSLSNLKAA